MSVSAEDVRQEEPGNGLDSPNPVPLTRYRRADELRKRHVDAMQDEVSEKVAAVIDSFRETPAKGERSHDPDRVLKKTRRQEIDVVSKSSISWLFFALIVIGFILMIMGWIRLF